MEHHATVQFEYAGAKITRRRLMKPFEYGSMYGIGARLPNGGALGDHYDVYSHMRFNPDHPENLDIMFDHALVRFNT